MRTLRIGKRGTSSELREVKEQNWAGDSYRRIQGERIDSLNQNVTVHLGRGIRTSKLKDLPSPRPRPSTEGMTRITNRGTSSRKSKNKGNYPA